MSNETLFRVSVKNPSEIYELQSNAVLSLLNGDDKLAGTSLKSREKTTAFEYSGFFIFFTDFNYNFVQKRSFLEVFGTISS